MTTPTGKTYLPGAAQMADELCKFLSKHGDTIILATTLLSPDDVAAMTAGMAAFNTFCALLNKVHQLYDPFYGKNQARAEP